MRNAYKILAEIPEGNTVLSEDLGINGIILEWILNTVRWCDLDSSLGMTKIGGIFSTG